MEAHNILFVGAVEKYPELYDNRRPDYLRRDVNEREWNEAAKEVKLPDSQNEDIPSTVEPRTNSSKQQTQTTFYKELTKKQIITNLFVLCVGFHLLFIAFNGLTILQSTINQKQGVGVVSQAIIYASFCITTLLLPKYTIKKLGLKLAMVVSMSCYLPYIATNFYFDWPTVIPSAILCGLGCSLLWNCHAAYFNESSHIYSLLSLKEKQLKRDIYFMTDDVDVLCSAVEKDKKRLPPLERQDESIVPCKQKLEDEAKDEMNSPENKPVINAQGKNISRPNELINPKVFSITKTGLQDTSTKQTSEEEHYKSVSSVSALFLGLFSLSYRFADIWSSLISFYTLRNDDDVLANMTSYHLSNCSCGADFCNVADSKCYEHNLAEPDQQLKTILTGAFLILAITGVLIVFLFLGELEKERRPVKFSLSFATATFRFIKTRDALLLCPLSAYMGLHQGFYLGDFTKSYVACAWGIYHVGLVSMCYGIATGISATLAGFMVKYVGRIPVMMFAALVNAGMNVYFLLWNPTPPEPAEFFISAALWGVIIGIIHPQTRAYFGVIFKNNSEAAYGGFYLWDSIGFCTAFLYSNYICTYIKIYILLVVSTLAFIGYLATEISRSRENKNPTLGIDGSNPSGVVVPGLICRTN